MNLRTTAARRFFIAGAFACTAALVPAAAMAAPGVVARTGHVATPACATSGLDVWLDTQGQGAAGTIFYKLNFTNLSGSSLHAVRLPRGLRDQPRRNAARQPGRPRDRRASHGDPR